MTKKSKGVGLCPYSPDHNSTAVLVGDKLYAGTAADYQGVDPIIYRDPLRSPQFDSTYLNNPSFVGSFEDPHFVYFFFREGAVEYMNCGKSVFSRVARVCKTDVGGTRSLNAKWTSFLKARLNCSVPGNYPFYFDEIQDISQPVSGTYGDVEETVLYGVFNTPPNSIGGSAVCSFRLADISSAFEGQFKEQRNTGDNWLAVDPHRVPSPRPGSCPNNSKELNDANLNFIKTHPLMNDAVPPFFNHPVLVRTGLNMAFTSIAVDPQVSTPDGSKFDVIFVGTSNGQLLKAVNSLAPKSIASTRTVIIEEIEVAPELLIKGVTVVRTAKGSGHVLVTTADQIRSFPLFRCDKARSCGQCVALQDPYCAWDTREELCRGSQTWSPDTQTTFLQAIPTGRHPGCGAGAAVPTKPSAGQRLGTVINQVSAGGEDDIGMVEKRGGHGPLLRPDSPTVEASVVLFSLETLIITVSAGAVAALVVGFVTGYCCGRKCQKEESNVPYAGTKKYAEYEYFEQRQLPARPVQPGLQPLLQHTDYNKRPAEEQVYAEPILVNHPVNVNNPLGTTLGSKGPGQISHYQAGLTLVGAGGTGINPPMHNPTMGGINAANKFNTISNVHKRGGGGVGWNRSLLQEEQGQEPSHYERGGLLLNRRGGGGLVGELVPVTAVGTLGGNTVYHMGTLSRASKNRDMARESEKQQQVVDSAYGTTRSVKKVYL
jgi:semaphorin 6